MFIIHLTDLMILEPIYRQKQYHFLMKLNKTCHSQAPKAILNIPLDCVLCSWPGRAGGNDPRCLAKVTKV